MRRLLNPEVALGFLIATLLWIGVLGWQASYSPTHSEKRQCEEAATKSGHKTEECKTLWERTTSDPVAFFTFWLAVSTIGLGISTIMLWSAGEKQFRLTRTISNRQAPETKDSIGVARSDFVATHRPWVSVETSIGPRGLFFNENGANLHLVFHCKNVGNTPALNVQIECRPYMATNQHRLTEQRNACEDISRRPNDPRMLGSTIFPGDEEQFDIVYSFISKTDLEQCPAGFHGCVMPTVVGCVDYQFPFGSGERRQTGFIYEVRKRDFRAILLTDGDLEGPGSILQKAIEAGAFFAT